LDPGIGFGKVGQENIDILKNIGVIKKLGYPVLVSFSNKRHTSKSFLFSTTSTGDFFKGIS